VSPESHTKIRTPDQRLRVFVSSTLGELAPERAAVRRAVERLRLAPVMFELGARPHPPRDLYRAYLDQSHVFVGIYGERYGWVAPGESVSGLEDEYRLAAGLPQLVYIKEPAPDREEALTRLLDDVRAADRTSYRRFGSLEELEELVAEDLAVLLSERFASGAAVRGVPSAPSRGRAAPPRVLTPTIGRDEVSAHVERLLEEGTRLVTITGPGGVGKTRVALEVAHRHADPPQRPVHWIPLADLTSPDLLLATVADRLGLSESAGTDPLVALLDHVRDSRALLVLDNLEQVVAAAPQIGDLIEQTPRLQVLATSRRPLRIGGEHQVVLDPLPTPEVTEGDPATPSEGRAPIDVDAVTASPAVALLLDRVRAVGGDLEVGPQNAASVAELCRRVEGLPLALELVAARLRLLSPGSLLQRLGSALDVRSALTGTPARQQTLRAALDWSHELLTAEERSLLARLGVFAGGAAVDAVEAVFPRTTDGSCDALDALAGLLDASLVVADTSASGGQPRFRLLEPVAEYARELLADSGEEAEVRRLHLEHYHRLGRRAQPYLCGPRQQEWVALFDVERPNLRVAMGSGLDLGEEERVLRLVWDTLVYFYVRDGIDEPRQWLARLEEARSALDEAGHALLDVALVVAGTPPTGQDPTAVLEAATVVTDRHGLALESAVSQHHLGVHQWRAGDPEVATTTLQGASQRYLALDHDWGVATVELTLGAVRSTLGGCEAPREHYRRALDHARRIDNRPQVAQALQGLGLVDALDGDLPAARASLREAVALVLEDESKTGASYCLEALAALAAARSDLPAAVRLLASARSTRQRLAIPEWTAAADPAESVLRRSRAALPAEVYRAAWQDGAAADALSLLRQEVAGLDDAAVEEGTRPSSGAAVRSP
jgi:predicted ATPase